jgi:anti-anti-sigma factor
MPKLRHQFKPISLEGGRTVMAVYLSGHIDAATNKAFDQVLADPYRNKFKNVVIDFSRVEYINSTGISTIIRAYRDFRSLGGEMVLAQVPREVGLSMHYLGLTAIVPFLKDVQSAVTYFRDSARRGLGDGYYQYLRRKYRKDEKARLKFKLPLWRRKADRPKESSILMVVPEPDLFTEILKLRLFDPAGRFNIVSSVQFALERFDEYQPDLIIIDNRIEGWEAFLQEVKIGRKRGLTSILKIYGRGQKPWAFKSFKVWENDYLIEPFEIMQIFHIAEAELRRVPRDRQAALHQVKFQFRSTTENLVKAQAFAKQLVEQSGLRGDSETAMSAAFTEALQNAVQHGNRRQPAKTVTANCILQEKKFIVYVEDEGAGFNSERHLAKEGAGLPLDPALAGTGSGRGGLGIPLMKRCVDEIKYLDGGRIVKLVKYIR